MRVLNLDPSFNPIYSTIEIKYESKYFSGGEFHFRLTSTPYRLDWAKKEGIMITHRVVSANQILEILVAVDALRNEGVKNLELFIPYVPYGRQDRVVNQGESCGIKVMANLLNSCGFEAVYTLDNHSDVSAPT